MRQEARSAIGPEDPPRARFHTTTGIPLASSTGSPTLRKVRLLLLNVTTPSTPSKGTHVKTLPTRRIANPRSISPLPRNPPSASDGNKSGLQGTRLIVIRMVLDRVPHRQDVAMGINHSTALSAGTNNDPTIRAQVREVDRVDTLAKFPQGNSHFLLEQTGNLIPGSAGCAGLCAATAAARENLPPRSANAQNEVRGNPAPRLCKSIQLRRGHS